MIVELFKDKQGRVTAVSVWVGSTEQFTARAGANRGGNVFNFYVPPRMRRGHESKQYIKVEDILVP